MKNAHELAVSKCINHQVISHNVSTGYFYIWVYHNGDVDTKVKLDKLKNIMKNVTLKNLARQILQLKNMKPKTMEKQKLIFLFVLDNLCQKHKKYNM